MIIYHLAKYHWSQSNHHKLSYLIYIIWLSVITMVDHNPTIIKDHRFGGFHIPPNGPQFSSISGWDFPWNKPSTFGYPQWLWNSLWILKIIPRNITWYIIQCHISYMTRRPWYHFLGFFGLLSLRWSRGFSIQQPPRVMAELLHKACDDAACHTSCFFFFPDI